MSVKKYTIEEIKSIVEPIACKYGVEHVYLFGSYARRDAAENSDVNLRVDKGSLKMLFALCGFYTEIEEALQLRANILQPEALRMTFFIGYKTRKCFYMMGQRKAKDENGGGLRSHLACKAGSLFPS